MLLAGGSRVHHLEGVLKMLPSCWELLLLPRSQSLGSTSPVDNSIENLLSPISTISDTYLGSPDQQRLTIASALDAMQTTIA